MSSSTVVNLDLPKWAQYFVELGSKIASCSGIGSATHAGVIVPRREFIATLAALGTVSNWARLCDETSDEVANARLISLESGAKVTVMEAGKRFAATFIGIEDRNGRLFAKLQRGKKGMTQSLGEADWHRIAEGDGGRAEAYLRPPAATSADRRIVAEKEFVKEAFGIQTDKFFLRDHSAALLVGQLNLLQHEQDLPLSVLRSHASQEGKTGSLLRTRRFQVVGEDGNYATQAFTDRADVSVWPKGVEGPDCVIFDGSNGYLRFRHCFPGVNSIAIFDRRSRSLDEAANLFNDRRMMSGVGRVIEPAPSVPPPGCEVSLYSEGRTL